MKQKSYKEMTYDELLDEELRVRELCIIKKGDMRTQKQYRKYLVKIQTELREYEKLRFGKAETKYGV